MNGFLVFIFLLALFLLCEKFCKPVTKGFLFPHIARFELKGSNISFMIFALRVVFIVFLSLSFAVNKSLIFLPLFVAIMSLIFIIYLQNRK